MVIFGRGINDLFIRPLTFKKDPKMHQAQHVRLATMAPVGPPQGDTGPRDNEGFAGFVGEFSALKSNIYIYTLTLKHPRIPFSLFSSIWSTPTLHLGSFGTFHHQQRIRPRATVELVSLNIEVPDVVSTKRMMLCFFLKTIPFFRPKNGHRPWTLWGGKLGGFLFVGICRFVNEANMTLP